MQDSDIPSGDLLDELLSLSEAATATSNYLRAPNFPIPSTFPLEQLREICTSLASLHRGTASGCKIPLEYARSRLPAIRSEHIPSAFKLGPEDETSLQRGIGVDAHLADLIATVATSLDAYRRDYNENLASDNVVKEKAVGTEGVESIRSTVEEAKRVNIDLSNIQDKVEKITSGNGEGYSRKISDAKALNLLAIAELRGRVVIRWFRSVVATLQRYPSAIRAVGKVLEGASIVSRPAVEEWSNFQNDVADAALQRLQRLGTSYQKVADELEARRTDTPASERHLGKKFDLEATIEKLIQGQRPDRQHIPYITAIQINDDRLRDISNFSELSELQSLDLSFTNVSSANPISSNLKIQRLNLTNTNIEETDFLSELIELKYLDISETSSSNFSPISKLSNLTFLNIESCEFSRIEGVSRLGRLEKLNVGYNKISDLSELATIGTLRQLDLSGVPVSDFNFLGRLSGLQKLELTNLSLESASAIEWPKGLKILDIRNSNLPPDFIGRLPKGVEELNLSHNKIASIATSGKMKSKLKRLSIAFCDLKDISGIASAENLEHLTAQGNRFSDLTVLASLKRLRTVYIGGRELRDISSLRDLPDLYRLDLGAARIEDFSPILSMKRLKYLTVANLKAKDKRVLSRIEGLVVNGH